MKSNDLEKHGGHDMLLCEREFGDAVFHAEFRYTRVEGKSGYNSGVYVRNKEDGSLWHQAQIGDATGGYLFGETPGADGKKRFFTTLNDVKDGRVKPAGEWNTMVIECVGDAVKVWVNGDLVNHGTKCTATKGQIALQAEGSEVEFRKLRLTPIRELSP